MEFDDEAIEILRIALMGADPCVYIGLIVTIWVTAYAVISLGIGDPLHAIWCGLIISTLALCALVSILIDYFEFKFKAGHNILHRYIRRSAVVAILSSLIILSLFGVIASNYFLLPLDIFTNNLFFVLIIPPLYETTLDTITMRQEKEIFNRLGSGPFGGFEGRFAYLLLTIIAAVLYVVVVMSKSLYSELVYYLVILMAITIFSILLYLIITPLPESPKIGSPSVLQFLLHIGAFLLMLFFIFRARAYYEGEEIPVMSLYN